MIQATLWTINRNIIDKITTKFNGIDEDSCEYFKVDLDGFTDDSKEINKFIKNPLLGKRTIYFSDKVILDKQEVKMCLDDVCCNLFIQIYTFLY